MELDPFSIRVLGSLMEKEMTTPEAYPLSLNAVIAAANQRTSRDPVLELSAADAAEALETLKDHQLVDVARYARVPKYEHRIRTVLNLRRDETALICLLLLRGAQTPGELRARADRMFSFDDLPSVQAALERLAARDTPFVRALPRQAGSRETRYLHLLGDTQSAQPQLTSQLKSQPTSQPQSIPNPQAGGELSRLQAAIEALESRVTALESRPLPQEPAQS